MEYESCGINQAHSRVMFCEYCVFVCGNVYLFIELKILHRVRNVNILLRLSKGKKVKYYFAMRGVRVVVSDDVTHDECH